MTLNSDGPVKPLEIVNGLRGVVKCFYLDDEVIEKLKEEEAKVKSAGGSIDMENTGFLKALERKHVMCVVKDPRFRPPPEATVILIDSAGTMLGTEVFPFTAKEYEGRDDVIWLSGSFILFLKAQGTGREKFILPPVSFPELNESNGCTSVISCSPAPTSDLIIKNYYKYDDDPRLASIVVAFNDINQE